MGGWWPWSVVALHRVWGLGSVPLYYCTGTHCPTVLLRRYHSVSWPIVSPGPQCLLATVPPGFTVPPDFTVSPGHSASWPHSGVYMASQWCLHGLTVVPTWPHSGVLMASQWWFSAKQGLMALRLPRSADQVS